MPREYIGRAMKITSVFDYRGEWNSYFNGNVNYIPPVCVAIVSDVILYRISDFWMDNFVAADNTANPSGLLLHVYEYKNNTFD